MLQLSSPEIVVLCRDPSLLSHFDFHIDNFALKTVGSVSISGNKTIRSRLFFH